MADRKTPEQEPVAENAAPEAAAAAEQQTPEPMDAPADEAGPDDPQAERLEELLRERDELKDRWLRAVAEQDNLRKRSRREVADAHAFATADVVRDMIEVLDDVERALGAAADDGGEGAIRQGVSMIESRLREALARRGVERLEVAAGVEFDPREHEAVAQIPGGDVPSGGVVEVMLPGYRLGDRVLRPARVVVAQ